MRLSRSCLKAYLLLVGYLSWCYRAPGGLQMDPPPKSTDSSILDDIKQALARASRCIELARKQRDRIATASPAPSAGGMDAANQLLEQARERREQLEAVELRAEMTPAPSLEGVVSPFLDQEPAVVPILEEQMGPA